MGVFKRTRKNNNGKKTDYWYIRYSVNRVIKWESIGKVGLVTRDIANAKLAERKKQIRMGVQLDMLNNDLPTYNKSIV